MRHLIIAALAAGLVGCSSLSFLGNWIAPSKTIEVVEQARSLFCGSDSPAASVRVFPNAAAFNRWQEDRGVSLLDPNGLAAGESLAVIEMGTRPTAGYSVAVSRKAELQGAQLRLFTTFLSPSPDGVAAQMITAPCSVVLVPDDELFEALLIDQSGKTRARWQR